MISEKKYNALVKQINLEYAQAMNKARADYDKALKDAWKKYTGGA